MRSMEELSPEIRAQIKEKAREFREKKENREIVQDEALRDVAGGAGFDPNETICGWTYTNLHAMLCWVYESYHNPYETYDFAKEITADVAESCIPSIQWRYYLSYSYPAFIDQPMHNIWCGLGL